MQCEGAVDAHADRTAARSPCTCVAHRCSRPATDEDLTNIDYRTTQYLIHTFDCGRGGSVEHVRHGAAGAVREVLVAGAPGDRRHGRGLAGSPARRARVRED